MENIFDIYSHIDILFAVFCRIFFAIIVLPIFTEKGVPLIIKGGIPLVLSMMIFPTLNLEIVSFQDNVLQYSMLLLKECLVGLILGFGTSIFFNTYYFFGFLISMQGGIAMSNVFDPSSDSQVTLLGKLYTLIFTTVFITTGGLNWFIQSICQTYKVIPVGEAYFSGEIVFSFVKIFITFFTLSFKLATPIIGILLIIDCGLGILARTVPQMNMFVVGIPLKILVLLGLLFLTVSLLPSYNSEIILNLKQAFEAMLQGMVKV